MIGIPPATEASYSRLTLFFSAITASLSPYFDIKALLAVITCFLFIRDEKTSFFAAPSDPPINSTTISTSLSKTMFEKFLTNFFLGNFIMRFLLIFLAEMYLKIGILPVFLYIFFLFFITVL